MALKNTAMFLLRKNLCKGWNAVSLVMIYPLPKHLQSTRYEKVLPPNAMPVYGHEHFFANHCY